MNPQKKSFRKAEPPLFFWWKKIWVWCHIMNVGWGKNNLSKILRKIWNNTILNYVNILLVCGFVIAFSHIDPTSLEVQDMSFHRSWNQGCIPVWFFKWFTGICDSYLYFKSDGSIKCGSTLDHGLTIQQASDQCAEIGAIIPELPSPNDRQIINIIRVIIQFYRYMLTLQSWVL